ncbi:uncharacterized protein LOC142985115 isoform X2 [Anticarsia gemmatalis]
MNRTDFNMSMFNSTNMDTMNTTTQGFNTDWRSSNSTGYNTMNGRMSCAEATESSEKVRRYADLAMWATRRLQDIAYAENFQKTDQYEENELILKLAWFLDQLALLTGYEPHHTRYNYPVSTSTTTSPSPATLVPQTPELVKFLINCVKANSSVPATVRCRYPLALPDMAAQIANGGTTTQPPDSQLQSGSNVVPIQDSTAQQSSELLITAENFRNPHKITKRSPKPEEYYVPIPIHEKPKPIVDFIVKKLSNLKAIVKNVKKHAVADFATQLAVHKQLHKRSIDNLIEKRSIDSNSLLNILKNFTKDIVMFVKPVQVATIHLPALDASIVNTKSFKKRSIDDSKMTYVEILENAVNSIKKRSTSDPLTKLANYYVKYKVWDSSNPLQKTNHKMSSNFDVNNHILSKRSLFHKKHRHFQLKPFGLIRLWHKKKHSTKKGKKIQHYLTNIFDKKHKKLGKFPHKLFKRDLNNDLNKIVDSPRKLHSTVKRSLHYEHMYLPRYPENPVGDISYYVKNKDGRNYNPSLLQAAQVRLALEQAFQTGNILVIQRYGSNYNPANPAPFYTGVLAGAADS